MTAFKNSVFIATSIDGFIADTNGSLDWLHTIPNPSGNDMGYVEFTNSIDALVMGRKTFETVLGFDVEWPYNKPVFVLSNQLREIPKSHQEKAFLVHGSLTEVIDQIHQQGYYSLYIDGGTTIRNFLKEDLIDDMILTTVPILLGGGASLFAELPKHLKFDLVNSKTYLNQITQTHYKRRR